jgi:hypothetical protein
VANGNDEPTTHGELVHQRIRHARRRCGDQNRVIPTAVAPRERLDVGISEVLNHGSRSLDDCGDAPDANDRIDDVRETVAKAGEMPPSSARLRIRPTMMALAQTSDP